MPLVNIYDSAAYSSTLKTLLMKRWILVLLLILLVFQMFFNAANAGLTDLCLNLGLSCHLLSP